ncbi:MAG: hypothetical protein WA817_00945 [Candidatus Acidiferrum sp.]
MTKLENTKPQSANTISTNDATRCQRRRPSGRRCKLAVTAPGAPFCFTHTQEFNKADTLNLKTALLTGYQGFQTAQGINNSLRNLYILLANNYISPRRAAVLAYISSLQLRTLPAIDADLEAGIADPTARQEKDSDADSSAETTYEEVNATAAPASNTCTNAAPGWDVSIPEPDPTKKPS